MIRGFLASHEASTERTCEWFTGPCRIKMCRCVLYVLAEHTIDICSTIAKYKFRLYFYDTDFQRNTLFYIRLPLVRGNTGT